MRPKHIIGIDVETTSLDPSQGEIIDVAAIRYDLDTGAEVARFETLCKPSKPIPSEISALTGITNEMVAKSPSFAEILSRLQEFIGVEPLFAHNAQFDTKWLTYHGLSLAKNEVADTFLLAAIAWPEAPSYNLGMLAAQLDLAVGAEHRAGADVQLTWQLLRRIIAQLAVSPAALVQIRQLLAAAGGSHYAAYFTVEEREQQAGRRPKKVAPLADRQPVATLAEAFAADGLLVQHLPGFTPRTGQTAMAEQVLAAFSDRTVALIEAGTGTGKTYAYLVAACLTAAHGTPVVISTYTKHLQDQLIERDIPTIVAALQLPLLSAVVKGRRNYLCDRRLGGLIERAVTSDKTAALSLVESLFLIKVVTWLDRGGSGDLEKINLSHQGGRLLRLLHADSVVCRLQCKASATCPYMRHKRQQEGAQLTVVNHAWLCQMAASGEVGREQASIVIDEAHHLEAAARKATALDLSSEYVEEIADSFISLARAATTASVGEHIITEAALLSREYQAWLAAAGTFVLAQSRSRELLLTAAVRRGSAWQKLTQEAASWRGRLKFILGLLRSLENHSSADGRKIITETVRAGERFGLEFENYLEGSAERIQWIVAYQAAPGVVKTYLHDVALRVNPILDQLFSGSHGAVLTSATLTVRGNFDYIKGRLGITTAVESIIEAPFDYRNNMLVYLVDDGPLPADAIYEKYLYRAIGSLSELLGGRLLALFTSQAAVHSMYNLLIKHLYRANIKVYAQKITGGRHSMLDKFRRIHESILLGTLSFWEGIDIPGESLSCVVIPKLSFPFPHDPVLTALAAEEKLNVFSDLMVPEMILRLRQGVGRLLRASSDRGVVVVLDPRLHRQSYGDEVLKSLPPATIHIGAGSDLLPKIREWFGEETIKQWRRREGSGATEKT